MRGLNHFKTINWVVVASIAAASLWSGPPALAQGDTPQSPSKEFDRKRSQLISDDSQGVISLGSWAIEHDLSSRAEDIYRSYLRTYPYDEAVYNALLELSENRELPKDSDAFETTRELLPEYFREFETEHFIILTDAPQDWAKNQSVHLERAHREFLRFVHRLKLKPLPIKHKLVCVLFNDRDKYQVFASEHDDVVDTAIAGHYSPKADRVVFYNANSNPSVSEANVKLKVMAKDIQKLNIAAAKARRLGDREKARSLLNTATYYRNHYKQQVSKVDEFIENTSSATTVHEAIHQLLFHTQVQTPIVQYPLWISEGLATTFETDKPLHSFGPAYEYMPRRLTFEKLFKSGNLLPVKELVTLSSLSSHNSKSAKALYHQSYALIMWMCIYRRTELGDYMRIMRVETPGKHSEEKQLEIFEEAFGDIERLERSWLRHEASSITQSKPVEWNRSQAN